MTEQVDLDDAHYSYSPPMPRWRFSMSGAIPDPISRRDMLRRTTAGMATLALGTLGTDARPPARPPNIVFILADDLGFADVACYGRPDVRTPNVDRLAAQGVRFLQAYANSAVCTATRVGLITGRYQYRLRVGLEEPLAGNTEVGLEPSHPTLPSLLRKAGYSSTLVGKWHLGALPKFGPLQSGYDHFYGFRGGAVDYYSHASPTGKDDLWDQDVPVQQAGYLTELLGSRAVDVVNGYARSRQPFMLSLHFNAPHWPWEAPGDQAESERLRAARKGLMHLDGGSQKTYQRMIEAMDLQIGRVLRALHDRGLSDDTIVVFTSDNGGERFSDTWPFTGKKTELLEGGLRIPAVISWPARIPRGPHDRPGGHQHGLGPDPARRRRHRSGSRVPDRRDEPAAGAHPERPVRPAEALLALQGERAAGDARRRSQVPQDPRPHLSLRCRGRPAGARQPEAPPAGRLSAARARVVRLEHDDAPGDRGQLHRRHQR